MMETLNAPIRDPNTQKLLRARVIACGKCGSPTSLWSAKANSCYGCEAEYNGGGQLLEPVWKLAS